jgi:hypothetical protein
MGSEPPVIFDSLIIFRESGVIIPAPKLASVKAPEFPILPDVSSHFDIFLE